MDTRINGDKFGSIVTFAALKKSSAPGQIQANTIKEMTLNKNK